MLRREEQRPSGIRIGDGNVADLQHGAVGCKTGLNADNVACDEETFYMYYLAHGTVALLCIVPLCKYPEPNSSHREFALGDVCSLSA